MCAYRFFERELSKKQQQQCPVTQMMMMPCAKPPVVAFNYRFSRDPPILLLFFFFLVFLPIEQKRGAVRVCMCVLVGRYYILYTHSQSCVWFSRGCAAFLICQRKVRKKK